MKHVTGFHFTLKDQHDNLLQNTRDASGEPMLVLIGSGRVFPALEHHIHDMAIGERRQVILPPEDAYGDVDPKLKLKVPRSKFPEGTDLKIGFVFQGGEKEGWPIIFRVVKIEGDDIYVDANPELAGLTLHYDVEVVERREATAEEISHGHAHRHNGKGVCG